MDFDENLVNLQGILLHRGDHDRLENLKPIFEKASSTEKTRMLFFLLLNTELSDKDILLTDSNVGLLTGICPILSIDQFSEIVVSLELINSLSDLVSNLPSALWIHIVNYIVLRGLFVECSKDMENLITGLFISLEKSDLVYCNPELHPLLHVIVAELVFSGGKEPKGYLLQLDKLFNALLICLDVRQNRRPITDNPIFQLDPTVLGILRDRCLCPRTTEYSKANIRLIIMQVLELCEPTLTNFVTLDCDQSVKKQISETAFLLYKRIENTEFEPTNSKVLTLIMKEPVAELGETCDPKNLATCDIDTLIHKLSYDNDDKNCIKTLINFSNVFEREDAIICISKQLDLVDDEDLRRLVEGVQLKFGNSELVPELFLNLYFSCLARMRLDDQLIYFKKHFETEQVHCWEMSAFDEELTEKINKLSDMNESDLRTKSSLIALCIQSPVKTVKKICRLALSNEKELNICLNYLIMLKVACLSKVCSSTEQHSNVINSVLHTFVVSEDFTPAEKRYLCALIKRLMEEQILDFQFFKTSVLEVIGKELVKENYEKVLFALELLKRVVKSKRLTMHNGDVLLFLVQALSHASWDCESFSMQLANTREIIISLISSISACSGFIVPNDNKIRQQIFKSSDFNRTYFCDFLSPESSYPGFEDLHIQLLTLLNTKSKVRSIIDFVVNSFRYNDFHCLKVCFNRALVKILPLLTSKEWTSLFRHLKSIITAWSDHLPDSSNLNASVKALGLFTTATYCLVQDTNRNEDMTRCLEYCLRNFGRIVQKNFVNSETSVEVRTDVSKKLLFLLNGVSCPSRKAYYSMILSPVVREVMNHDVEKTSGREDELRELVDWFNTCFI